MKNRETVQYPNPPFAFQSIPHSVSWPVFTLPKHYEIE